MADVTVRAVLQAQDNLTRVIDKVDRRLNSANNSASRLSGQFGTMGKVLAGAGIAVGIQQITRSIVRMAGASIEAAGDFDRAIRSVEAKTGATAEQMGRLTEQARELGKTTLHTAQQAADGQAFLAQAGLETNEVYDAMPGVLNLATAGTLELSRAADISSNILVGFNKNASEMNNVADIMATIAASANTNIEQLGTAMSYVAPVATSAGVSIEKTSAIIGALSDAGIQASKAGTGLRGMIVSLSAPSNKAQESLDALGLSFTDSSGKLQDFDIILEKLAPHYENTALMAQLFGKRQIAAAQAAIAARDKIADLTVELENSEGAAQEMADIMGSGLHGDLKRISSALGDMAITLGNALAPAIQVVADLLQWLVAAPIDVTMMGIATVLGTLAVAASKAGVAFGLAWTAALGPIGLITAGIAGIGVAVYALQEAFGEPEIHTSLEESAKKTSDLQDKVDELSAKVIDAREANLDTWPELKEQLRKVNAELYKSTQETEEFADKVRERMREVEIELRKIHENPYVAAHASEVNLLMEEYDELKGALEALEEPAEVIEDTLGPDGFVGDADDAIRRLRERFQELEAAEAAAAEEAKELAKAAKEANDRFMEWAGSTQVLTNALSAQALKSGVIQQAFRAAGDNSGLEFNLGFMDGPGGVMTQLPQNMMKVAEDGSWTIAGGTGGDKMAKETASVFDKFGGWSGMFTGVMGAFHGFLDGGWKGGLSQMANMALSFLPPGMAQAAQAALGTFKAVWNKFFKKPSEAELQARESFSGMREGFIENIGQIPEYQEYVNSLLSQGWDRNLAEVKAGFDYWAQQAGLGFEESGRLYTQYQDAIKAGDNEEVARIEAVVQGWRDRGAAISEAAQAEIDAAQEAAEAHRQFMDGVFSSVIGAWDRAKAAGEQAFTDSMALHEQYNAAIEEGDAERAAKLVEQHGTWITSEESALAQSEHNQNVARQKLLDAEKAKYVRLAAFEAALEAIRSGNAEGAAEAARLAAEQTAEAWDTALGAVAVADEIANNTVEEGATTTADHVIEEAERTQQETIKAANEAAEQQAQAAELAELERIQSANDAAAAEILAAEKSVEGINAAFEALEDHTVTVNYRAGEMPDVEGRAAGGPVTAGVPYVVGERGPELFVPRRDGGIIPNGGSAVMPTINVIVKQDRSGRWMAKAIPRAIGGEGGAGDRLMPFTTAGATRMLDAVFTGDVFAHLHTSDPPTTANTVTGSGYAGVQVTGGFASETAGSIRRRTNNAVVEFPTPGGVWSRAVSIGLWDRLNIAPNPADPPGLVRSASIDALDAVLNDSIQIPAGGIDVEIEVTD